MAILSSLILGTPGKYSVPGISVKVAEGSFNPLDLGKKWLPKPLILLANKTIYTCTFRVLAGSYLNIFVHEMGHALVNKGLTGGSSNITIYQLRGGSASVSGCCRSERNRALILVAGPVASVIFSAGLLTLAASIRRSCRPLSILLGSCACIEIAHETLYALFSTLNKDSVDFGSIRRISTLYLIEAWSLLLGIVALGIYASLKLKN